MRSKFDSSSCGFDDVLFQGREKIFFAEHFFFFKIDFQRDDNCLQYHSQKQKEFFIMEQKKGF